MSLTHQLTALETHGLIRLAVSQPELEYLFRHTLVQDAAYHSLVKSDRRALHLAAGEAVEALYPEDLDSRELAPLLGRHFAEGGDDRRALKYFQAAGEAASRVYAIPEAIAHFEAARQAAERVTRASGGGVANDQWISLYSDLGRALELSADYAGALARYGELEALAQRRDDRAMRLAALMARAKIHATVTPAYDPPLARTLLERALALARVGDEAADRAAEARALWNLMVLETFSGADLPQAIEYGEEALRLARELDLREQLAFTLHDLHYAYGNTGQAELSEAVLDEARALWRELSNQAMLADNLANKAIRLILKGELANALPYADEALEISRSIGNAWGEASGQFFLGRAYLEWGQTGKAIEILEEASRISEQIGLQAVLIASHADLAWAYASLGALDRAVPLARKAIDSASLFSLWKPWAQAALARVQVMQGDLAEAEATVAAARRDAKPGSVQFLSPILTALADAELRLAQGRGDEALDAAGEAEALVRFHHMRVLLPEALYVRGLALRALGRPDEAQAVWQAARAEAEAIGSRLSLWPVLAALSRLEAEQGNLPEAQALRREAQTIVSYIADHVGEPALRSSFVALDSVRQIMAEEAA